ncbi:MAG: ABC transporter substrate-binding protein [Clostridia bacterium]|nr:ABC transporter substrate-binding protein [Clostridia bacterium]
MKKAIAIIISIILLAGAAAGCSGNTENTAREDNSLLKKFNIGHLPATGHILYFIAYEEGFFEDEGLDVTLTQFDNNTAELAALEAGKIDVAPINATNLIKFLGEGHELTSFGGVMSDGHALVVSPEILEGIEPSEYKNNLELLKGKTIVLQAGSTYDIEFRIALRDAGFDLEKDINILTADSGTSAYNSLKSKEIDGAAVYAPFRQKAIDDGFKPIIYCDEIEYFEHPICCRNVALSDKIKNEPDIYIAFTRAMIRAGEFLQSNHAGAVADAKKYLDLDENILESEIYNHSINNPDPDEEKTVTFYNAMKELGYIDNEIKITDYINNDIYSAALSELISKEPDNGYYIELLEYHSGAVIQK